MNTNYNLFNVNKISIEITLLPKQLFNKDQK